MSFTNAHAGGATVTSSEANFYEDIVTAGLTSGLRVVLDAGSADAGSGQSWLDVSGNGVDFFRGADGNSSTDDPAYNGTLGNLSSSEYYSYDGGDFFTYDSTNESWMQDMHKDNAEFSIAMWLYNKNQNGSR